MSEGGERGEEAATLWFQRGIGREERRGSSKMEIEDAFRPRSDVIVGTRFLTDGDRVTRSNERGKAKRGEGSPPKILERAATFPFDS